MALCYFHLISSAGTVKKPDNIGFDGEGSLKLFDFGLAKELLPEDRGDDGLYQLTGLCGAIRYMAPEVGLSKRYNLSADLYSWSMLMWNILALEPPMGTYTPNMFIDRVFQRGCRPVVKDKWPKQLGILMSLCWSENIAKRPSFKKALRVLREEAMALDPGLAAFWGNDQVSKAKSMRSSEASSTKEKLAAVQCEEPNKESSTNGDSRSKDERTVAGCRGTRAVESSIYKREDQASEQQNGVASFKDIRQREKKEALVKSQRKEHYRETPSLEELSIDCQD